MVKAEHIMTRHFVQVRPEDSVGRAISALLNERANLIVVVDADNRLQGLLPGSVVLRGALDSHLRQDPVSLHMLRQFATVSPEAPIDLALDQFVLHDLEVLPVVAESRIQGVIERMAANSFSLKEWAVGLASAVLVVDVSVTAASVGGIAVFVIVVAAAEAMDHLAMVRRMGRAAAMAVAVARLASVSRITGVRNASARRRRLASLLFRGHVHTNDTFLGNRFGLRFRHYTGYFNHLLPAGSKSD